MCQLGCTVGGGKVKAMKYILSVLVVLLPVTLSAWADAELVLLNGDIHTVDPATPRAEALAVTQGRFVAVGSNEAISHYIGASTRVIDAAGRTVTPGFIDGHSHVRGTSPAVYGVDLSYVVDKGEWLERIAEADQRMPAGEWITGGWWDHTLSDGQFPNREMLDRVVSERPVLLNHIDGHYSWANTRALTMAGVNQDTPVPPGGKIMIDPNSGEPTGILLEGAQDLVRRVIPEVSEDRRRRGLADMQQYANRLGITGLHQMGAREDYLFVVEHGDPTIRVWYGEFGPTGSTADDGQEIDDILNIRSASAARVAATGKESRSGPLFSVGYVKLTSDGVLSAHTAVLEAPYHDREGWTGDYIIAPGDLAVRVKKLAAAGLPVAIHAIGDAAVHSALDAFEAALDHPVALPHRVEHMEIVLPGDIERFRALGVVASMQPNHATNAIGYVPDRVGPVREAHAYVWRSLLDAGVPLVFGADYATSPLSPLVQMADAMFRQSPFGYHDGQSWHPEQAVTFAEALHAYTQAGANVTSWRDAIGSITVGKWADFVLLDGTVPEPMSAAFRNLSVSATYFAGREVYAQNPAQASP